MFYFLPKGQQFTTISRLTRRMHTTVCMRRVKSHSRIEKPINHNLGIETTAQFGNPKKKEEKTGLVTIAIGNSQSVAINCCDRIFVVSSHTRNAYTCSSIYVRVKKNW